VFLGLFFPSILALSSFSSTISVLNFLRLSLFAKTFFVLAFRVLPWKEGRGFLGVLDLTPPVYPLFFFFPPPFSYHFFDLCETSFPCAFRNTESSSPSFASEPAEQFSSPFPVSFPFPPWFFIPFFLHLSKRKKVVLPLCHAQSHFSVPFLSPPLFRPPFQNSTNSQLVVEYLCS